MIEPSEPLTLRGKARPVKRFSRKALAVLLGTAGLIVLGSFALAMQSPSHDSGSTGAELYSTSTRATADGLAGLPASYADVTRPALGPALPGDLGAPMLRAHREGRINLDDQLGTVGAPESNPLSELEAALRLQEAELANAARTSQIFFSVERQTVPDTGAPAESFLDRSGLDSTALGDAANLSGLIDSTPSGQSRREAFVSTSQDESIYNPFSLQEPVSPHQIMAGTVIPATLLTGFNSDLPGQTIAQITEPIYDTVTGNTLLIPQGSRIIGRYDSTISFGQSRALIIWTRIIMPDGSSIQIDNLPGTDERGFAGLRDRVDRHTGTVLAGIAMSTILGVGAELASNDEGDIERAVRESIQEGTNQSGQDLVRRSLNIPPTITIRPGWRLRILVNSDIILRPYGDS
ncbi:MAG: TrbI/VirB10 family protein [Pseudomonadota bacterium]